MELAGETQGVRESRVATRVLVADAQLLVADALAAALSWSPSLTVLVERPVSGVETIETAARLHPDVVLVDYWMTDMSGTAITRMILSDTPAAKVLVLSWFHGARQVVEVLQAGAVGFLPKSVRLEQLSLAIEHAKNGRRLVYQPEVESMLKEIQMGEAEAAEVWRRLVTLTTREIGILQQLNLGLSPTELAKILSISTATVRTHIHNLLEKLGAGSQVEALAIARRYGLIQG